MAESENLDEVEILTIKVETPDFTEEVPSEPVSKNGDTSNEGRSKRQRKSTLYAADAFDSESEPQSDGDIDPEFKPTATTLPSPGNISKDLQITGYALFCNGNRSTVEKEFPEMSSSKISMKLSHMWSSLPAGTKRSYSCRARHLRPEGNSKKVKSDLKKDPAVGDDWECVAFCCLWGRCDFQFEMVDECAQHISDEHLRLLCVQNTETLKGPASCCWRGCLRQKRCSLPFVQFDRLLRHMSEEHVLVGKPIRRKERSHNFIPRRPV